MATVLRTRILDRDQAISALTQMRQEWEEANGDLLTARASVGELLGDVTNVIGLTPDEQRAALGDRLYNDLVKATR